MFKIPARVITVDYVGIASSAAVKYRSRALAELEILQSHMEYNKLKQCKRTLTTGDNVKIDCHISHGAAQATVIIGADSTLSINEHACFCTAYGILAGRILKLKDEVKDAKETKEHYINDQSYAADVIVCQKTGLGRPKRIESREIRSSMGETSEKVISQTSAEFYLSQVFYNIPFTDRSPHEPGELVLILAMPLVDYRPSAPDAHAYAPSFVSKHGAWSPEVNKRRIVSRKFKDPTKQPNANITTKYNASTGLTNMLTLDANIWDGKKDNKKDDRTAIQLALELRYNPFRILPVSLDTCFTGYK